MEGKSAQDSLIGYTVRMKYVVAAVVVLSACGAATSSQTFAGLAPQCDQDFHYDGKRCVPLGTAAREIEKAKNALAAFDVDTALPLLEEAIEHGPHDHEVLIQLYEQRGIAYSYLKMEKEALESFDTLLTLDPGHLLNYTLSPQTTFLFERARTESQRRRKTALQVSFPHGKSVGDSLPITVEVIADPKNMLRHMALYMRYDETSPYHRATVKLGKVGELSTIVLPALNTNRPVVLQLYGSAYDKSGDEVLLWFDKSQPREIPLSYRGPSPWYRKWWVWAIAGGTVAVATGVTVYVIGLPLSANTTGTFEPGL